MPLCSCSLRFAARSLAFHPPPSVPSIHSRLPLSSPQWLRHNSTGHGHANSPPHHDANEIGDEGTTGWFKYLDAVLGNEPPDQASASPAHPAPSKSTAPRRVRSSSAARARHADLFIKPVHVARGSAHSRPVIDHKQTRRRRLQRTPSYLHKHETAQLAKDRLVRLDAHVPARKVSVRNAERFSLFYSRTWHMNFAKISRPYDKLLKDQYLQPTEPPVLHPEASKWAKSIIDGLDGTTGAFTLDAPRDEPARRGGISDRWTQIALWLLAYDKDRVIDFLLATHCEPYPPFLWIEDCLSLLARHYTQNDPEDVSGSFTRLIDAFKVLACRQTARFAQQRQSQPERMSMSSSFVRLLLPHSSNEQVNEIYRTIKLHRVQVHSNTYHHISTWFAKNGHLEQGIDALLSAHETGSKVDSLQFRQNCSTLLRMTMQHPGGLRLSLRLVDNLVAMGVKLEGQLSTIIMLNAVEAGDPNTAFLVYRSMTAQGLPLAAHDHAIILRACKANIEDVNTLTEVIQGAVESGLVRTNPILATEILHCLALHHTQRNPTTVFTTVKDAYLELFRPHALQKLGLPIETVPTPSTDLHEPSQHALNFLIAAYLENATEVDARILYFRWRELLKAGDEHATLLASTPHTGTIFLARFTRRQESLLQAANVIKDMQRRPRAPHNVTHAVPDAITWSVFLNGFARHGRTKLAHQVLSYMRKQGIKPTKFTLNNLVAGCAGAQDLDRTMDALREFSLSDEAFDEWTYKGLGRFRDQTQLKKKMMRETAYEQQLDFTGEMREKLMEKMRHQRPEEPVFRKVGSTGAGQADSEQLAVSSTEGKDVTTYRPMFG